MDVKYFKNELNPCLSRLRSSLRPLTHFINFYKGGANLEAAYLVKKGRVG